MLRAEHGPEEKYFFINSSSTFFCRISSETRQENASSFEDEAEGFGKSLFLKVIKPEGREDRRSSKNASAFFDMIRTASLVSVRKL
jgi:hypothetical protein